MAREKPKDNANYRRLLGVVYIMILFGLTMVLSASSVQAYASTGDSYYFIKRQVVSVLLGSIAMLILSRIPIRNLQKLAPLSVAVSIILLIVVLIPGVGKTVWGSSRWISIAGFNLQPSEIAKLAIALFTADYLVRHRKELDKARTLLYPYGLVLGTVILLVMKQPDMGTTLSICIIAFTLIFVSGFRMRYIIGIGTLGVVAGMVAIRMAKYRMDRYLAFLNPEADPLGGGYQILQSLIAFGSGGLLGIGLGMGRQKYFYLPAAHTDFIFAIIGEELGLLGAFFTISLFAAFAFIGITTSLRCKNSFGKFLGAGLTSMITLQALINMGAVTGLLPITGIPMPFISYGGSSIIVNLASVGILLSIALEKGADEVSSKRKKKSDLRLVEDGASEGRRPAKDSKTRKRGSSARLASDNPLYPILSSSSKSTGRSKAESTERSKSRSSGKSESKSRSSEKGKNKTGGAKANADSNKRRRDSGSRVSGTSPRKRNSKKDRES